MYQPPDLNKIPIDLQNLFLPITICLGDLNAKHFMWGSSGINSRGVDLLNMVDDKGFLFLNDGSPTHYSHSYNSKEALDVTIVIPTCNWTALENIGSDHLLILFELNKRQITYNSVSQSNHEQAANILEEHYQLISSLNFTGNGKYAKTVASNVVHGCRSNPHVGPAIFNKAFSAQELDAAILVSNLNTSPGPDGIEKVIPNDCEIGIFADDIDIVSVLILKTDRKLYNFRPRILLNSQPIKIEKHPRLSQIIDPSEGLDGVYFHVDLTVQVSKQKELPCYLKLLALERIHNVPKDAVHMCMDGSKIGSDCSGSGIYISFRDQEIKMQRKNPDSCSIHFQWILSHVNIAGNEIADSLARAGSGKTAVPATPLTYLELFSKYKAKNNAIWMNAMISGGSLVRDGSRRDQSALTRFLSGHLMSLTFIDGMKHFEIFTKCSSA
ncbi:RNase H domain-containing protein [Trichonephila clavipes]|nr:RNase H domain-containing protein [Trichonephila clavipes]